MVASSAALLDVTMFEGLAQGFIQTSCSARSIGATEVISTNLVHMILRLGNRLYLQLFLQHLPLTKAKQLE